MLIRIISYLFSALALGTVGIFVLLNNSKAKANKWLFAFTSSVIIWILALNFADNLGNVQVAETASRVAFAVGPLVFFSLFKFSQYFPRELPNKQHWISPLLLAVAIILAFFSPTELAVVSVKLVDYGAEVVSGPLYAVLAGYILLLLILIIRNLRISRRLASPYERQQLRYLVYGLVFMIFVALTTNLFLVLIGISSLGFLGPPSVLLFVLPTAYAIVRHRLFDIRVLVARSLVFIFSIAVIAFAYAYLTFGLAQELLLKNVLNTDFARRTFSVVLAVLLAFTFPYIRQFFERITDRIFFRDRYDPQLLISEIGRILASEIRLEQLSNKVLSTIDSQMRVSNSNIVVVDGGTNYYQAHKNKSQAEYQINELSEFKDPIVVADELAAGHKRQMFEQHNVRVLLVLKTKESLVGYLLIGDKRSGDIFTNQDIQTLGIIADELAIAIQNARSYQEIQAFNETLREKVRQATKELRHANTELKALDKAKDEFISMASHQLRTPLTAVRGYTSMVMDGDFGKVSGEQKDTLKQSFDAATRMSRLIDDLLNVSRIQSGKFKIERSDTDLNTILPEELTLLETTAATKKVQLTYHAPAQPVPILQIDEGKTRQALMNLMDNAIYYSSSATAGGKVDVYLESDGKHVTFKVVDNGIGVPKDQQAKLFKKFYRAPNAQKTRPDGTGLGLFLVGKVVHGQGGEIIFESKEGAGSTFGFKLPVESAGDSVEKGNPAAKVAATQSPWLNQG